MSNTTTFTIELDMNRISCENMHKTIIKLFFRDVFAQFRVFLSFSDFIYKYSIIQMDPTTKEMATGNELDPKKACFIYWGMFCPTISSTTNDYIYGNESYRCPPQ